MTAVIPASLQLEFLIQVQGRLVESKMVTTHKYALLQAIADLC